MASVKICGLTDVAAADAAVAGGARFLGFTIYPKSPRNISIERAAALAQRYRGRAEIVALTVDASDETLAAISAKLQPDWVQLHGREEPQRTAEAARFARLGVIKVLGIARADDLAGTSAYEPVASMLMFDAKPPPGSDRPGGHGIAFDWKILSGRRFSRPWLLAGGLNPENVADAISASGAALVDVSSGVESAPGVKDPERIARFLKAAGALPERAGVST